MNKKDSTSIYNSVLITIILDWLPYLLFFISVYFFANPVIRYFYPGFYRQFPVETYSSWFLKDAPFFPGKIANQTASLLSPLFSSRLWGTICVFLLVLVLTLFVGYLLRRFGANVTGYFDFVPMGIIFIQLYYLINPLNYLVSTVFGLICIALYLKINKIPALWRLVLFVIIACAVFVFAPQAFILTSAACVLFETVIQKQRKIGAVELALASLLPPLIIYSTFQLYSVADLPNLLLPIMPKSASVIEFLHLAVWLSVPFAMIAALSERFFAKRFRVKLGEALSRLYAPALILIAVVSLTLLSIFASRNDPLAMSRSNALLNYAVVRRDWDMVLSTAKELPAWGLNPSKVHVINRALFHKGMLLDDLFKFQQGSNTLLYSIARTNMAIDRFWGMVWAGETNFELGLINSAEHCCLENITQFYFPQGLALLAKIYVVKQMPEAARSCLNALREDAGYRKWAEQWIDSLSIDEKMSRNPEIAAARSNALQKESLLIQNRTLGALLEANPSNRMAFEYQAAAWLIERNLDSLALSVPRLRSLSYPKIPRLIEEALILSATLKDQKPDLCGYTISPSSMQLFERFYSIFFEKHRGDLDKAHDELLAVCGETFFFRYLYGGVLHGAQ